MNLFNGDILERSSLAGASPSEYSIFNHTSPDGIHSCPVVSPDAPEIVTINPK